MELNCLNVVKAIRGQEEDILEFDLLIFDCRLIFREIEDYTLYFVHRFTNMFTHRLVRASISLSDSQ